jgi:hypothetical protein
MIRYQPTRITLDMTTVQQSIAKIPPRRNMKNTAKSLSRIPSPSYHSEEQSSPSVTPKSTLKGKSVVRHMYDDHSEREFLAQEDGAHDSDGESFDNGSYYAASHDTHWQQNIRRQVYPGLINRISQQDAYTPDQLQERPDHLASTRKRSVQVRVETPDSSQTSQMVCHAVFFPIVRLSQLILTTTARTSGRLHKSSD